MPAFSSTRATLSVGPTARRWPVGAQSSSKWPGSTAAAAGKAGAAKCSTTTRSAGQPASVGRALHCGHEACRAAAIGQRVGALLRQQRGQVQRRVGVVRMHLHATRPGRFEQPPGKGQALGAAHADVQFEVLTRRPEHFGHRQQRRQADAAGQQQVPRRRTAGQTGCAGR
jgi:hypothetical protein